MIFRPRCFLEVVSEKEPFASWIFHAEEASLGLLAETSVFMGARLRLELTQIRAKQKDGERQDPGDII